MKRPGCVLGHANGCKLGSDIEPGDIIRFFSETHRVDRIEPMSEASQAIHAGTGVGVARAADGWGISLGSTTCVEVV